jgi:hypothetical protein
LTILRTALTELIGLFIDDGSLALFSVILIAAITAAVKVLGLPPFVGAVLLLIGCIVILADSVRRAVKARR